MKSTRNRLLVALLTVAMLITTLPTAAFAEIATGDNAAQTEATDTTTNTAGEEASTDATTQAAKDADDATVDETADAAKEPVGLAKDAAPAASSTKSTLQKTGGNVAKIVEEGQDDKFYETVQLAIDGVTSSTQTVQMIADSEENVTVAATANVTLDLNGYVLSGKTNKAVISITNDGTNYGKLTVTDSNTDSQIHNFEVTKSGLWTLTDDDATVKLEELTARPATGTVVTVTGGCITGGSNSITGGGGIDNNGTLNFDGGNIVGNTVEGNGGGIWSGYETFVSDGNIVGNIATSNGGGIWSRAVLNISGANILYNTSNNNGGGVCNDYGKLNLSGGKISGNIAETAGGGIYHVSCYFDEFSEFSGYMTIGGTAVVADNALTIGTTSNLNIYDETDNKYSVEIGTGGTTGVPVPKEGMSVGVTLGTENGMGQFTANGAETDTQYFTSDKANYTVKYNAGTGSGGYLELTEKKVCKIGDTEYKTIAAALDASHEGEGKENPTTITMIADDEEDVTIDSGRYITLDLNGHELKHAEDDNVITNKGILTLKDSTYSEETAKATGRVIGYIKGSIKLENAKLADQEVSVDDAAAHNTTEEGKYTYNNAVWLTGSSTLTNVNINEKLSSNNTWKRVRGIYVTGEGNKVDINTEEGKTTEISFSRDKARSRSLTGWSYGISLGDGNDNAAINFSGKGDLKIAGNTTGGGDESSPYGYSINGIEVNGSKNTLTFSNEGKTTITESGMYGVNALCNYGTTEFTKGSVLINNYIDGGIAFEGNIGLYNRGSGSKINVAEGVAELTVFTEGAAYNGAAAIYNASYVVSEGKHGATEINAKKLNVLAVSGEDTNKEWTIGGTTVTGHTKYNSAKAEAKGAYSPTYGILNEGADSIKIGENTVTNIITRDFKLNSVAVGAIPYDGGAGYIETNGSIEILGDSNITAEGGTGTLALYATDGNSITIGSNNKKTNITGGIKATGTGITTGAEGEAKASSIMLQGSENKLTGDITVESGACISLSNTTAKEGKLSIGANSILNLANTTIECADISNSGTIVVDMSGNTAARVKLIDYIGTGTVEYEYGISGTNYKFAEGKDNGYVLKVMDNDLYAVKPVASITNSESKTVYYTTVQDAVDKATSGQTVQMIADSEENVTVADSKNITLDLNGHVLNGTGTGCVITNSGKLTITDSNTEAEHYFNYTAVGAWTYISSPTDAEKKSADAIDEIDEDTTVVKLSGGVITGGNNNDGPGGGISMLKDSKEISTTLSGGSIVGCQAKCGGAVYQNEGTLVINGGNIYGCFATESGGGVDSYANEVKKATVTFSAGSIQYCTSPIGGGIYNRENSTLQMSSDSAKIAYCSASNIGGGVCTNGALEMTVGTINNCTANKGGGVFVNSMSTSVFKMTGGSITGNTATARSGGVEVKGTLTLGGTAAITGNTLVLDKTTSSNNVYLNGTGKTINVQSGFEGTVGVSTSVTPTADTPVAITGKNSDNYSNCFTSDNANYIVINEGEGSNQVVKLTTHVHKWEYTASKSKDELTYNDTITAACKGAGTCNYEGSDKSLTIAAPSSLVYDGESHNANFGEAKTFLGESLPKISYKYNAQSTGEYAATSDTTAAGYYKASFTVGTDDGAKTAYVEYQVTKATPKAEDFTFAAPSDLLYNTKAKTAKVTAKDAIKGMGGVTVAYYSDAACTTTAEPINVGTYYVGITVTEGDNYKATEAVLTDSNWKFTIEPAAATVTVGTTTTYYASLTGDKGAWTYAQTTEAATVKLLADASGELTNESGKDITLDLNGHVLKGTGTGCVITNSGTLTIADSDSTAVHYFTYKTDGAWTLYGGEGVPAENVIDLTEFSLEKVKDASESKTYYINVSGGCITGGCSGSGNGGGVLNQDGTLNLQAGNIIGNTALRGGGVYTGISSGTSKSTFTMSGGTIAGNSCISMIATAVADGGGVFSNGTFNFSAGSIAGNTVKTGDASYSYGGGVSLKGGMLAMSGTASISGNACVLAGSTGGAALGGGVYCLSATMTMKDSASISGNACYIYVSGGSAYGGGVCNEGTLTMSGNSLISDNVCKNYIDDSLAGGGGGVANSAVTGREVSPKLTMTGNASIKNNKAAYAGGVINGVSGTITMSDSSSILSNTADAIGGVWNAAALTMSGSASISGNADTNGMVGGVYIDVDGGNPKMIVGGAVKVTGNTAGTGSDAIASNVYLPENKKITVSADTALEDGALIGVTTQNTPAKGSPIAITGENNADYSKYFTSDNTNYVVVNSGDGVTQVVKLADPVFDNRFGGKYSLTGTEEGYVIYTSLTEGSEYTVYGDTKYTFGGWYTGIDGTGTKLGSDKMKTPSSEKYYAKWTKDGKTVVTKQLDFTDESTKSAYATEVNGIQWNTLTSTLTLSGTLIDIYGDYSYAIKLPAGANLKIAEETTNTVKFTDFSQTENGYTIDCVGALTVNGKGQLTINGNANAADSISVYGVRSLGDFKYSEATLNAETENTAIVVGDGSTEADVEISGGTITANVASTTKDGADGIHTLKGDILISAGSVTVSSSKQAIVAGTTANAGTLAISGGTVSATGTSTGLWASGDISISAGTVTTTATGTGAAGKDYGINSQNGDVTISGGIITADGAGYGIRSKAGNITISGAETVVTAKGDAAAFYGLSEGKNLKAKGFAIKANAAKDGSGEAVVMSQDADGNVTSGIDTAKNAVMHQHKLSYAVVTNTSTDDTLKAWCTKLEICDYYGQSKADTLTIVAPEASTLTYDGTAKAASLVGADGTTKTTLAEKAAPEIKYYVKNSEGGWDELSSTPVDAGTYKASISVDSGEGKKTAYVTYEIAKRQLSISGTKARSMPYNNTKEVRILDLGTVSGIVDGDDVQVSGVGTFEDKNAGENKPVTVKYSISGTKASNYIAPVNDTCTATIYPCPLKVSDVVVEDKVYDGTKTATVKSIGGTDKFDGDDVSVTDITAEFLNANVGKRGVMVSFTLGGKDAGNYYAVDVKKYVNITKRSVTLYSESVSRAYNGEALTAETVYKNSDKEEVDSVFASEVDGLKATGTVTYVEQGEVDNPISYTFKDGFTADNYDISKTEGKLTITPVVGTITITADSDIKVYDGKALTDYGYTYTQGVLLDGDVLTAVVEGSMTNVGAAVNKVSSYVVMRGTTDVTGCYNIETEDGVLQVTAPSKDDVSVDTEALTDVLKDAVEKYDDPENYPQYAGKQFAVEFRTDEEVEAADSEYIISKLADMGLSDKKVVCIDAELWLVISDEDDVVDELNIGDENENLVTATYKFDFTKKTDIRIFRLHTDSSGAKSFGEITSKPNELGEYIEIDEKAGTITVCAMKYSTFAVAYNEVADAVETNTGDSNDVMPYAMMLIISVLGLAGCGLKRRQR